MKRLHFLTWGSEELTVYSTKVGSAKHPYTGESYGFNIRLFFSKFDGTWARPGKLAGRLVDDGNGVTIKLGGKEEFHLGYDEVQELELLLRELEYVEPSKMRVTSQKIK